MCQIKKKMFYMKKERLKIAYGNNSRVDIQKCVIQTE